MLSRAASLRSLAALRCVTGVLLLARPVAVARRADSGGTATPTLVVRILGTRMLTQAAVTFACPTRGIAVAGAGVDLTHAGSMCALAVAEPGRRRAALISAAEAAWQAAASLVVLAASS